MREDNLLMEKLEIEVIDLPKVTAAENKIIAKSGKKFRRKSPWTFSFFCTVCGFLSLPFWSNEEYSRGYKKGVLSAAHERGIPGLPVNIKSNNFRNFLITVTIGAFVGVVIGLILVFSGKAVVSIIWGSVAGATITTLFTLGTYLQMGYYSNKGFKEGKNQFNLQFKKLLHSDLKAEEIHKTQKRTHH